MSQDWTHVRGDPKWLGGTTWKATVTVPGTGGRGQRTRNFEANGITKARKLNGKIKDELRGELAEEARYAGTINDLADRWLNTKRLKWSPTTYYNAEKMMGYVRAQFGTMPANTLTALHLDEWYDSLLVAGTDGKTPLSGPAVGHYHALIHSMLRQGHKWKLVDGNCADLASPPARTARTKIHDTPTPETFNALLRAAPPDLLLAARMAAGLGCRRGEVVGLRWSDIDVDAGTVTISRNMIKVPKSVAEYKTTKTDDVRTLGLDEHLQAMLQAHADAQGARFIELGQPIPSDGPIFLNWRGPIVPKPRPPGWITKEWSKLCAAHGVKVRFHALRHMTATQLLGAGHSLADVAKQLGHADPSVTARVYAHALPKADSAAAATMGGLLGLPVGKKPAGQGSNLGQSA